MCFGTCQRPDHKMSACHSSPTGDFSSSAAGVPRFLHHSRPCQGLPAGSNIVTRSVRRLYAFAKGHSRLLWQPTCNMAWDSYSRETMQSSSKKQRTSTTIKRSKYCIHRPDASISARQELLCFLLTRPLGARRITNHCLALKKTHRHFPPRWCRTTAAVAECQMSASWLAPPLHARTRAT
jgi:hypothetical protein